MRTVAAWMMLSAVLGFGEARQDEFDRQKNTALVRVHPHLDQLLVKAEALIKEGRYVDALTIFAACEKYPNHVVPLGESQSSAIRYLGVQEYCMSRIAEWPEEGLAAYRSAYDPLARQAFEQARDSRNLKGLAEVAARFPHSTVADDALAYLGTLHLEAGRFITAADFLERALALAGSDTKKEVLYARLGSAYAAAGKKERLADLVGRAERAVPDATVVRGDGAVPLVASLRDLLTSAAAAPPPAMPASSSWEMMQGHPSGIRIAEATPFGPSAWRTNIPATPFDSEDDPWGGMRVQRPGVTYLPVIPAVADGIVYYHTDYAAYAFNLYAGSPEQLWTHRLEPPPGDLMYEDRLVHSTAVHEGRVFVNLISALGVGEKKMNYIPVKFAFPKRALFCLDAYSGKVEWKLGGAMDTKDPEDGLTFATAPTPCDGLLYVGAILQERSTDLFRHHVLCIDPATGKVLWSTFVASGGTEINLFGNSTRESLGSPVAVDETTVYYVTNHGILSAIERTTGRLRWLYKYQQLAVNPTRRIDIRRNSLEWLPCAPVVARGQVIFTPTDSNVMIAIDARTGAFRWEKKRTDGRSIAGSDGTHIVVAGECLEWYDIAAEGKLVGRFDPQQGRACGRATLATDGIYFPTTHGLYKVPLTLRGSTKGEFTAWPGARVDGGNIVAAEGAILVAGNDTIDALFNRRDLEKGIDLELQRSPDSVPVVYQAALRLLQSGKEDRALELFRRVVELAAKSPRPEDARLDRAARKRLFSVSMESGRTAMAANRFPEARGFFQKARDMAPDLASTVEAAAAVGEAAMAQREFAAAIGEFQKLLQKHAPESPAGQKVFDLARGRIAAILEAAGRDPYQPFEKEAGQRLAGALQEASADGLVGIFRSWPNSLSAEKAVIAAAGVHSKMGRTDEAVSTLRLFLREFPSSPRSLEVQVSIVPLLEKRSLYGASAAVLRKILRMSPDAEVSIDGRTIKVKEFVEERMAREEYKRSAGTAAPVRLAPPLKKASTHVEKEFPLGGEVLHPKGQPLQRGANLVFMNYYGAVKALDPATGAEVWRLATESRVTESFTYEDALILCSDSEIRRIHPLTGAVEWRHAPSTLAKKFCLASSSLCYLGVDSTGRGGSWVSGIDPARGTIMWNQSYSGVALEVLPLDDFVAVVTSSPNRVHLFETDSGRRGPAVDFKQQGGNLKVLGMIDGLLAVINMAREIECVELPAAKSRWTFPLKGMDVFTTDMSRTGIFIAARSGSEDSAMVLDLRNGKRRALADSVDWGMAANYKVHMVMDEKVAVVATRINEKTVVVRALNILDSRLPELWTYKVEDGGIQTLPKLTANHVVVLRVGRPVNARFEFSVSLLDNEGKPVQNIKGDEPLEKPADIDLINGALLLLVENRVEVHR